MISGKIAAIQITPMTMNQLSDKRFIIKGITPSGEKFRPSDWAERMCGNLCSFRNRRMIYSPLLRPAVIDGFKCVFINEALSESHPNLFKQLIEFAKKNKLEISEEVIESVA